MLEQRCTDAGIKTIYTTHHQSYGVQCTYLLNYEIKAEFQLYALYEEFQYDDANDFDAADGTHGMQNLWHSLLCSSLLGCFPGSSHWIRKLKSNHALQWEGCQSSWSYKTLSELWQGQEDDDQVEQTDSFVVVSYMAEGFNIANAASCCNGCDVLLPWALYKQLVVYFAENTQQDFRRSPLIVQMYQTYVYYKIHRTHSKILFSKDISLPCNSSVQNARK